MLEEERALMVECSNLDNAIRAWLAAMPAREAVLPVPLTVYEDFCASSENFAGFARTFPRALLQRFMDVCWSAQKQPGHELYSRCDELWNELGGPMFKCDMLVDTTCSEQCDWQRLASEPYDFGALESMAYDELFVRDVAVESPGDAVMVAKFIHYSQQIWRAR